MIMGLLFTRKCPSRPARHLAFATFLFEYKSYTKWDNYKLEYVTLHMVGNSIAPIIGKFFSLFCKITQSSIHSLKGTLSPRPSSRRWKQLLTYFIKDSWFYLCLRHSQQVKRLGLGSWVFSGCQESQSRNSGNNRGQDTAKLCVDSVSLGWWQLCVSDTICQRQMPS